jgi:hypothetical protein
MLAEAHGIQQSAIAKMEKRTNMISSPLKVFLLDNLRIIIHTYTMSIRRIGEFDKMLIKLRDNTGKALILDKNQTA